MKLFVYLLVWQSSCWRRRPGCPAYMFILSCAAVMKHRKYLITHKESKAGYFAYCAIVYINEND